jgi:hypothetical protein
VHVQFAGHGLSILGWTLRNSAAQCRQRRKLITHPSAILKAADRLVVRCRTQSAAPLRHPDIDSTGSDRFKAWLPGFSQDSGDNRLDLGPGSTVIHRPWLISQPGQPPGYELGTPLAHHRRIYPQIRTTRLFESRSA